MAVKLTFREKEFEVRPGMTLRDSLSKINIQPEAVLAIRDGEMITDEEILKEGQVIRLISVISGGCIGW